MNARTVTNTAKKAIRLAGLKDVVVSVSTQDNGNGTFSTLVETIHDRSKTTQEKVVDALKTERFAVSAVSSEGARFDFRPLTEAEAITVALITGDQDAVDGIAANRVFVEARTGETPLTVTTRVRRTIRDAGHAGRISKMSTERVQYTVEKNGRLVKAPVLRTFVEVLGKAAEIREALLAAGYIVAASTSEFYVNVYTARRVDDVERLVKELMPTPAPALVVDTMADVEPDLDHLVEAYRAQSLAIRQASRKGDMDEVLRLNEVRTRVGRAIGELHSLAVLRLLNDENEYVIAVHPLFKGTLEERQASRERLSTARHNLAKLLGHPVPSEDELMTGDDEAPGAAAYDHLHFFQPVHASETSLVDTFREVTSLLLLNQSPAIPYGRITELFDAIDEELVKRDRLPLRDALVDEATYLAHQAFHRSNGETVDPRMEVRLAEVRHTLNTILGEDGSHLVGVEGTFDPIVGRGTVTGTIATIDRPKSYANYAVATLVNGARVKVSRSLIAATA
jgi:hypothetical protein